MVYVGIITKVVDKLKFIIECEIPGYIDKVTAQPLNIKDEPNVGDTVALVEMRTSFGNSYLYEEVKTSDEIRFKLLKNCITINEELTDIVGKTRIEGVSDETRKGLGGFCRVKICPYSGDIHVTDTLIS